LPVRGGLGFLDRNDVVPAVAEIVEVGEALDSGLDDAVQRDPLLVGDIVESAGVAIVAAGDVECVEMPANPAHRRQDRLAQVPEGKRAGNQNADAKSAASPPAASP
jgi:hypothetical protein